MKSHHRALKWLGAAAAAPFLLATSSHAVLVIGGVTDGDLPGGIPKAIILTAGADVADLTQWGVGSANNGGGSDGEELTLPAGSVNTGDAIVIAGNTDSFNFFANNFVQNFTLLQHNVANINGDDAIELFMNGSVFDTYGEINMDGTGLSWDYQDGFAQRIGGGPGAFDQANYSSNDGAFDGLTEQQHIDIFVAAGFTAIPEPASVAMIALGLAAFLRRRR